jgi:hypothetical protein
MKLVLSRALMMEGAKESIFRDSEWASLQIAGKDGSIGKSVLVGRTHRHGQIPGVKFYVFIADQIFASPAGILRNRSEVLGI